jgi:NAD(P)-dependent dehydrogenase (short-subunit alcohol dehydrogenase family)
MGNALFFPTDVSDSNRLQRLFDITMERFGRLDCLVNCAGIPARAAILGYHARILGQRPRGQPQGAVFFASALLPRCFPAATDAS